jgi:hypothetical protein
VLCDNDTSCHRPSGERNRAAPPRNKCSRGFEITHVVFVSSFFGGIWKFIEIGVGVPLTHGFYKLFDSSSRSSRDRNLTYFNRDSFGSSRLPGRIVFSRHRVMFTRIPYSISTIYFLFLKYSRNFHEIAAD